jgi:hypothetical protein
MLMSSPVFREAKNYQANPDNKDIQYTVTLLDSAFETSAVFKKILLMITKGELDLPTNEDDPQLEHSSELLRNLIFFVQKWDCTALHSTILRCLYDEIARRERGPLLAFVFGAVLADEALCALIVQKYQNAPLPSDTTTVLDPQTWPDWAWENCPGSHTAAFVPAWMQRRHTTVSFSTAFQQRLKSFKERAAKSSW